VTVIKKMQQKIAVSMPSIACRLADFIGLYDSKIAVGNTAGNRGECVGLVEVWFDYLGLPHIWGNAKDLLINAPTPPYVVTINRPTNYPVPGDVIVWGDSWGQGFGHTGICVTGHVRDFTAFEQNDPAGSTPHLKLYGYAGVLGWLHPVVTA
jgi:CHAP domain-containing protein